jgi:hypothetical protein
VVLLLLLRPPMIPLNSATACFKRHGMSADNTFDHLLQAELRQLRSVQDLQQCISPRNEAAALALLVANQQGVLLILV